MCNMASSRSEQLPDMASQETTANSEGNEASFAFFVHSQESLSQQAPPDIDNQRLARQKRRRTSPEDHAILEAEYERNPKPDKTARLEIVKKVALGEKEVQIWFQNRRQVTRRKSRPLLPHEVFANLHPSSQDCESAPSSSNPFDDSTQHTLSSSQTTIPSTQPKSYHAGKDFQFNGPQVPFTLEQALASQSSASKFGENAELVAKGLCQKEATITQNLSLNDEKATLIGASRSNGLSRSLSQTLPKKRRPEICGNRRSASFIIHDDTSVSPAILPGDIHVPGPSDAKGPMPNLKRSSSLVRLSMCMDGKAQVTTGSGTTPSPPRPQTASLSDPLRRTSLGFQRSFSAIEPTKNSDSETPTRPSFRRAATGRSRDARTWEFYCDKDARDALTEQAEREESGSATAAIALIKSNSNSSKAMAAHSNKRNAKTEKLEAAKRLKSDRPKLGRSQSSAANMQTVSFSNRQEVKGEKMHHKSGSQSAVFECYDGDSDKENWLPGTRRSPPRRRPAPSSQSGRILEESLHHSSSLGALMSQERSTSRKTTSTNSSSSSDGKENGGPEIDDEIAAFMGNFTAPREADELDCVQNLLSLSQAAWQ